MILSRRVALNGLQLDELYGRIVIRGVETGVPDESIKGVNLMGGAGQRVASQHWETMEVTVRFAIDVPKTDLITRRRIWEDVCSWAMGGEGGWLTVNYLLGRRFFVDKAVLSAPGDLREWTDEYTITFRAYHIPFWQDEIPAKVTATNSTGGTMTLRVGGMFPTVADVDFTNTSGSTMSTFSITAGGNTISLTGLALADDETLKIHHGTDGILRITEGGRNAYGKQSTGGANDLYVNPGNVTVAVAAQQAGNLTVSAIGRYA